MRGIVAKNTDGNISYVTENKVLAEFAEKAFESPPIWEDFRDFLKKEKNKTTFENFCSAIVFYGF